MPLKLMDRIDCGDSADAEVLGGSTAVREQLERLCRSVDFGGSPRAEKFLRFVVAETLAGRGDKLSQRTIAHGIYGRNGDFDPGLDPLVRVQAGRVRRALEHYYLTEGKKDPVVISLPKGSYAPKVERNGKSAPVTRIMPPVLFVEPFRNESGCEELEFIAQGLGSELAVALDQYQVGRVILLPGNAGDDSHVAESARNACKGATCFVVRGRISQSSGILRVAVRLEEFETHILRWSEQMNYRPESGNRDRFLDQLVERVAASIAEEEGAIAQHVFKRMESVPVIEANAYEALLHLYHAERCGTPELFEKALVGLSHAVEVFPEDGRLWSGLARMCTLNHILEMFPDLQVPMEEAIRYAERGVSLRGADQRAWCILGFAQTMAGNLERGHEATLTALSQHPDSHFFRDGVGYLLILQGDYERGAAISKEAVELNPFVRDTVFCGLWLDAFRRKEFDEAHAWAARYMDLNIFWAPVMRAAALAHLGRRHEARTSLEHLLLVRPDFRESGPRLIRKGIKIEELARRVEEALRVAGLEFTECTG